MVDPTSDDSFSAGIMISSALNSHLGRHFLPLAQPVILCLQSSIFNCAWVILVSFLDPGEQSPILLGSFLLMHHSMNLVPSGIFTANVSSASSQVRI